MRTALYALLLLAETLSGMILMGLLYSNLGWPVCVLIAAVLAVLLVRLVKKLIGQKHAGDGEGMKKTRRQIALVMLLPTVVGLCCVAYVVISLLLYF